MSADHLKEWKDEAVRAATSQQGLYYALIRFWGKDWRRFPRFDKVQQVADELRSCHDFRGLDGRHRNKDWAVQKALLISVRSHKPHKGHFLALFRRNLLKRLQQEREKVVKEVRVRATDTLHTRADPRDYWSSRETRVRYTCEYWREVLLFQADPDALVYLTLRWQGLSRAAIAEALDVPAGRLRRKYGDRDCRAADLVRDKVNRLVAELPADRRTLLVRHLYEVAHLEPDDIQWLLGHYHKNKPTAPVLAEKALLGTLGWTPPPSMALQDDVVNFWKSRAKGEPEVRVSDEERLSAEEEYRQKVAELDRLYAA